ncbi:MAG: ATP-binding protein [Spirochaetes bacterium]|nr:ATP-binding protein [Spirochaetota bacterium]
MSSITSAKAVSVPAPVGSGTILADRRALATVFRNLLSNAVKYSRKDSSIRCSVSLSEKRDAVVVSIEDSGVGMKPDQIAKLFVPGRTMLTLGTGGEQGKGFGLAISKLFVEAMGGEIRVWSEYGAGTRFELYFPIAPTIGE